MDLRSIIHTDASSSTQPPRRPLPQDAAHRPSNPDVAQRPYGSPYNNDAYQTRTAPPPLQSPAPPDFRSPTATSFHSAQSPQQYTPSSSSTAGGQYPFPPHAHLQSPRQPQAHAPPQAHRDFQTPTPHSSISAHPSYGHAAPPPYSPTYASPGSSYPYQQPYPPYSTQSTPTSAQSQTPNHFRGSPASSTQNIHVQTQSHPYQYSQQPQVSQHSQPGTPLGPPSANYHISPASFSRDPTSPELHQRSQPNPPYRVPTANDLHASPPLVTRDKRRDSEISRGQASPPRLSEAPLYGRDRAPPVGRDRSASASVSPKSMSPAQTRKLSIGQTHLNGYATPSKRKFDESPPYAKRQQVEPHDEGTEAATNGIKKDTEPGHGRRDSYLDPPLPASEKASITENTQQNRPIGSIHRDATPTEPRPASQESTTLSPTSNALSTNQGEAREEILPSSREPPRPEASLRQAEEPHATLSRVASDPRSSVSESSTKPGLDGNSSSSGSGMAASTNRSLKAISKPGFQPSSSIPPGTAGSGQRPQRKRTRYDQVPIFAKSALDPSVKGSIPNMRLLQGTPSAPVVKPSISNSPPARAARLASASEQPEPAKIGPLGPWEPSFTNVITSDDVTKLIADILFVEVVNSQKPALQKGGMPPGAQVEIEAKLGELIDKDTGDRLKMPILTECVLSKEYSRTRFESTMTENQHKRYNQFLNKATADSRLPRSIEVAPPKPRIPLVYVHTKERDRFYELTPAAMGALPPAVHELMSTSRHRPKVRVTTDSKTGQTLATIIKIRSNDVEVYSPRTSFDWRLSISLEMPWDGDVSTLIEVKEAGKPRDRNKDRLSYRHLAFQIDLTQVTVQQENLIIKEHELEIEVSADKIREQGLLAMNREPNQYEDLVKGFVDNIRILARAAAQPVAL